MPFTHIEIEGRKSKSLALLFFSLFCLYTGSVIFLVWGVKALAGLSPLAVPEVVVIFEASFIFGVLHWWFATRDIFQRIVEAIGTHLADPADVYHAKLINIVDEVSVALGGRKIQAYVIPTPAVNACAFADTAGSAAIAVTEGMLAVLSRAQLEAVVGHEAAHIASGDSLTGSVFCALFALHEEALKWFRRMSNLDGSGDESLRVRVRVGSVALFILAVLWATSVVKKMGEMFISREKEYRADSIAVRLTRDPLSLAEALEIMSRRWRGAGARGDSFSSIFIMDTGIERLSEREGMLASLFSTHPPTGKRIDLLLGMAHLDATRFEQGVSALLNRKPARTLPAPIAVEEDSARWMTWDDGRWAGPFGAGQITDGARLMPDSWIKKIGEERVKPAYEDPQLLGMINGRYGKSGEPRSAMACPKCRISLNMVRYEGAPMQRCPACGGFYADLDLVSRVFSRQEYDFPEPVKRLGKSLLAFVDQIRVREEFYSAPRPAIPWACPACGGTVVLKFYSEVYLVEVEQCRNCRLTWFDSQELELLQYLFERVQAENPPHVG